MVAMRPPASAPVAILAIMTALAFTLAERRSPLGPLAIEFPRRVICQNMVEFGDVCLHGGNAFVCRIPPTGRIFRMRPEFARLQRFELCG